MGGQAMSDLPAPMFGAYSEVRGPGEGFGLGFSVTLDNVAQRQIGSDGTYSWGGAANTYFWIDPQERLFFILMTQTMMYDEHAVPIRSKLRNFVYGSIADRLPFQPVVARL